MARISVRDVKVSFGTLPVLDGVSLQLEAGERVGLVGRNGEGKSTLLKLIGGQLEPDEGRVDVATDARVALLPQYVPVDTQGTVREVVTAALGESATTSDGERAVERTLSRLDLDGDADVAALSAGLRRRVWLARALALEPDVLLLDEPTNHLDIATIGWLEQQLLRHPGTLLLVTHDRSFLDALASRIVELDRGRLLSFRGSYADYARRKQQAEMEEARDRERFDKKLGEEEAWLRTGIKARRTRNEGRVRALEQMRAEHRRRRERMGSVRMSVAEAERSGKLVIEAESVSVVADDGRRLVADLSTLILRGDRVGIIGPNNCGKTTLLRTLVGRLAPSRGRVRLGTRLELSYFDQLRATLDEHRSVADNVADGAERFSTGSGERHVLGYLADFLFPPERARSPVSSLSGGERSRLLLAKLFAKPSNVLVLDEPTNDLDIDTLELLEGRLLEYAGTVLLVSHDRALLNNVVTSTLVFEGDGAVGEYAGGYDDWLAQRSDATTADEQAGRKPTNGDGAPQPGRGLKPKTDEPRRLTFKEQRELDALPLRIETLEQEQQTLQDQLGDPAFYREPGEMIAETKARLEAIGTELEAAFERWQELDEIAERRR